MKKIIAAIIIIVLLAGAAVLVFLQVKNQSDILDREAQKISSMDIHKDSVDMNLYCFGDYMAVEDTMKTYINSYIQELDVFTKIMTDERISNSLSIENIQASAPEFTETLTYLENTKEMIDDTEKVLLKMAEEDEVLSAIDDSGVSYYQRYLYKKEMMDTIGLSFFYPKEELDKAKEDMISNIDSIEAVLKYLIENNGKWNIADNMIKFENDEMLAEYQALVAAIG